MAIDRVDASDAEGLRALALRLDELSLLSVDWDSYGGLPPTARAIAAASRLMIEAVAITGQVPDAVLPFPNGGLQVVWERDAHELQVDVGPDGGLGYLSIRRDDATTVMDEAEDRSLADVLALVGALPR